MIGKLAGYWQHSNNWQRNNNNAQASSVPHLNHGKMLAEVFIQVPHLLQMVDSKALVALQSTCTSLRQTISEPILWQQYLSYHAQYIPEVPASVPPPPPPLHQEQSFYQQCAIWHDLHQANRCERSSQQTTLFLPKYQAWLNVINNNFPQLYKLWYAHQQQRQMFESNMLRARLRPLVQAICFSSYIFHSFILSQLYQHMYVKPNHPMHIQLLELAKQPVESLNEFNYALLIALGSICCRFVLFIYISVFLTQLWTLIWQRAWYW